ncbi:protein YIPF3-like [Watersipora subatra]|uniref:protein YIPF3-like n=1 Tax=Watersipora subatra TaxID=2589382 RepID=UPI00355C828A
MANSEFTVDGFDDVEFGSSELSSSGHHDMRADKSSPTSDASSNGMLGDAQYMMKHTVTSMMWEAGKSQATKAWGVYGNIDLLRPYFDVEPSEVLKRIVNSFVPKPPTAANPIKVVKELYGPTMLVLTLIALLLFEMKSSGHTVKEGTLIGTAFGTCFGYWIGCGTLAWLVSYVCNTHITYLQIISMIGYSLASHCIVVFLSTIIHTSHDHMFFYTLWGVFGGLSTLRMVSILLSRTHGPSQKMVLCAIVAFLNLSFLLYLHFAYHKVVEELGELIKPDQMNDNVKVIPTAVGSKVSDH